MFTHAILRKPGENYREGITTAGLGPPDLDKALEQHASYCDALRQRGLELTVLEADLRYPDCPFVEDTAIVTERCAVIARPGRESRRGEEESIEEALRTFRDIEQIKAPGTLDGGDVLRIRDHFYVGLSKRTNAEGARQLADILSQQGYTASTIPVNGILHLKTGVTCVENRTVISLDQFVNREEFRPFHRILVDENEHYAANCLEVNGTVVMADGFPKTRARLEEAGHEIAALNMSEYQKMDGGLTCLSLLF